MLRSIRHNVENATEIWYCAGLLRVIKIFVVVAQSVRAGVYKRQVEFKSLPDNNLVCKGDFLPDRQEWWL